MSESIADRVVARHRCATASLNPDDWPLARVVLRRGTFHITGAGELALERPAILMHKKGKMLEIPHHCIKCLKNPEECFETR